MKLGLGAMLTAGMAAAVVVAALSGPARAADDRTGPGGEGARATGYRDGAAPRGRGGEPGNGRHSVPEFDPAAAGAIAALLAGGALTIASRRSR
jgi:hypothetical protein